MRWLLFVSRVTLIGNVCFLICLAMRYVGTGNVKENINSAYQGITGTIIVLGFSAFALNFLLTLILLIRLFSNKKVNVPVWLRLTNLLIFVVQLLFFL